ncbi:unnamed protein product [Zymoseptoria tritici ST99CH_1A5]|uniref:Uncharacterized protein n=1 Tax=Zymoseptoria tritici ST99CH_1A5 TaxID=1276529 RepID=A0A1Y6M0H8_ZYMTR|nr:unnamed protein product [Zymoseptoria tritici ST99CH_1A5]
MPSFPSDWQIQETHPAPPITKTRLTQKQSQEIVSNLSSWRHARMDREVDRPPRATRGAIQDDCGEGGRGCAERSEEDA